MAEPTTRITTVERDGLVLDVLDEGPVGGEPILLLHGFPERASCWRLVAPILNEAGYRTLAMTQRGYAPGARPRRRRDYVMAELLGDARALVEQAGGRAHVVGHDWGAIPSWLLAMHHPDLVASLTAVSVPHPQAFLASMVRSTQGLKSWYMLAFQLPWLPEYVLSRKGEIGARQLRAAGLTADDLARFRAEIVDDGALRTALNWYRAMPLGDPRLTRGRVRVPTTMVWSDEDIALGRWGVERTASLVDAPYRFVELNGVSHWIPTQAPEALANAILDRVRSTAS
ncbi:alpha/beta fold hydrolase [Nocardioides nitrophenolicus]|uniref:alpha/beta fold hydrolase n=1 Tax=Nocardioides nitrophenolicus TaxID=60489 RepID=UPI00195ADA8B|nr:alpha/beta fold hydrolase [Nocardioides nitrophenolicus]MBM7516357.1 pimeloyl-ACP methyl ester carboxylesterase [Nocardioides nitrophenolicus]